MERLTKYFGFLAVAIVWIGHMLCLVIHNIDWFEPLSQFGYYTDTKFIFGSTLTLALLITYLFARHLDVYWKHTSLTMLCAGIFLTITGWVPYEPYVKALEFDLHNAAITLAIILLSLPMLFISFKREHSDIAKASKILFFATATSAIWSVFARVTDNGIVYAQLFTLLTVHTWLVIVNALLLRHYKQGKLDRATNL